MNDALAEDCVNCDGFGWFEYAETSDREDTYDSFKCSLCDGTGRQPDAAPTDEEQQ